MRKFDNNPIEGKFDQVAIRNLQMGSEYNPNYQKQKTVIVKNKHLKKSKFINFT